MTHSRRVCRQVQPCEPRALLEAIQCCVLHSDRESSSIAEALGVRRGYLLDAANPDREELQFQARLLSPLMHVTQNATPLRYLAREQGFALVELPRTDPADGDIRQKFLHVVTELGEGSSAIERALSDGEVTADEAARIHRELDDTIEALMAVKALVQTRAKGRVA